LGVEVDTSSTAVWNFITDTKTWPLWGPSVKDVDFPDRYIGMGSRGKILTPVGIWLPFEVNRFEERNYWDWRVNGFEATGHRVMKTGPDRCRLIFTVPFWALAYSLICKLALLRVKRLILSGACSESCDVNLNDANTIIELGG